MLDPQWRNLVSMFFDQAERLGERPFLWSKRGGQYQPQTWREVAARVCSLARGLKTLGVSQGDRVLLIAENRPAWPIADLAIMAAGGITVPTYTTNTTADFRHILTDSGACGAIVSSARLAQSVLRAAAEAGQARFLVSLEPLSDPQQSSPQTFSWREVIARGDKDHSNVVAAAAALSDEDIACIIYTSGTGGTPKGVMLDHGAILHNCAGAADVLAELGPVQPVFLSFLPLSHAYEHTIGQFVPMAVGAEIYYAEGVERLAANFREARPSIIIAVPRFYELMHQRISQDTRKLAGWQQWLFLEALRIGRKRCRRSGPLSPIDRLLDPVLKRLVRDRLRERFGGRLVAMISGGAPLNPEVGTFFTALGLPVYQGYGQTEAAPLVSVNRPTSHKMHTVGPPITATEVRIAGDGEILVRGRLLMRGYWQQDKATAETIRDGWLHTGDIGEIDGDGHIRITDRKKDLIVNSGGDNISPSRIETLLTLRPEIAQAMVFGDRRPHLVALIVANAAWAREWAEANGRPGDLALLAEDPGFIGAIKSAVETVNAELSVIERIRKFALAPEAFTIENGQLTPTLKIRRHMVVDAYQRLLEGLYG